MSAAILSRHSEGRIEETNQVVVTSRLVKASSLVGSRYILSLTVLVLLVVAAGCNLQTPAAVAQRNPSHISNSIAEQSSVRQVLLIASPPKIDMGEVHQGKRKHGTFSLTNSGTRPVEVVRFESSCPCLQIAVPQQVVPGSQVLIDVDLDLRNEPGFSGGLSIEIRGWTIVGEPAFFLVVEVNVLSKGERGESP